MDNDPSQLTQPATQQVLDPRRLGRNNSGLTTADISDVICILHPSSPAAFRIVANTATRKPQHVLQNDTFETFGDEGDPIDPEEQETFVIDSELADNAQDLALRFSSETVQPVLGFCFGRNSRTCDIVLDTDSFKRVSNLHFRIYVNQAGVLMLEDMSTNGTLVDEKHLKGKGSAAPATRMLHAGSIIQIPSVKPDESIKFIVRIPSRSGYQDRYARNLRKYINHLRMLEDRHQFAQRQHLQRNNITQANVPLYVPSNPFGMHWDGGEEYNVVGMLGKGAFATVFKLATKMDGKHYAAKELEKKRVIKNGRLDQRLDNEMQIMKSIRHENIVQYINYMDHAEHLYIIMEYVPCGDLQGYLSKNAVLPEKEAKLMSRQVLDALHYLHGKQITHRDIKPDNILISSLDPFTIKLSDFGLSKVVSTNETFLKTFCGTLLFCAPEVFPHYDDHMMQKGVKRRRSGNTNAGRFHSYSQSVDIWSYAAVLWLSMCGKPPFEGVADNTGKGMFNKIMETRLDINPLLAHGVSTQAIDLLCRMLTTDPSKRPTEIDCLGHPWLYDGRRLSASQVSRGLRAIAEEEEGAITVEGQARAFSQLSVRDAEPTAAGANRQPSNFQEEDDEIPQFDSGDLDFLDPRQSKRVKADQLVPRHHVRDQAAMPSSSPELSSTSDYEDELPIPGQLFRKPPRLFGEIGDSALESSGVLGEKTNAALDMPSDDVHEKDSTGSKMAIDASIESYQARQTTSDLYRSDASLAQHPSLMGTESELRELHMMEPPGNEPGTSGDGSDFVDEPQTPRTPDAFSDNSYNTKSPPSQPKRISSQDGTPRQNQINESSLPATMPPNSQNHRPLLGVLKSTADSIAPIELQLYNRVSHWGRHPGNTFIYPDQFDTRISKRAFVIWFHAYGIEKEEREGHDWRRMPDVHTIISTNSSNCIWINGERLTQKDTDGEQMCGRLYTGDVITIFDSMNRTTGSQQSLKFVCEFYVGQAETQRPEDLPFKPIRAVEPSQPRQSF
jgi:serine/threonine protein kinase